MYNAVFPWLEGGHPNSRACLAADMVFAGCQTEADDDPPVSAVFMEMASVPGGNFSMSSPETDTDSSSDERLVRTVTLSAFKMGKYEVTQSQWETVMGTTVQEIAGAVVSLTATGYRLPTEAAARPDGLPSAFFAPAASG